VVVGDDSLVADAREWEAQRLAVRERTAVGLTAMAFVATAAALIVVVPSGGGGASPGVALGVVLCFALASRVQFEVGFASAVPTQLAFMPMLFLVPLGWAPALVAAGFIAGKLPDQLRGAWHRERIALSLVSSWFAVGPVLVLWALGEPAPTVSHLPIVGAALAAQFAFDFAGSAARGCAGLGLPVRVLPGMLAPAWLVDLTLTPLGLVLAEVGRVEPYAFLLGLPLMGLLAYFARERKARIDHALELSHAYRGTALLLGDMVEADDTYTGLHSQDVVSLVLAVSEHLHLGERDRLDAELTALLHDIGKVRIPDAIINKPGPLSPEEREVINTHTIEGERMLEQVGGLLGHVGHLVRSCHERWDGAGYPDGLAGESIPLISRIVCTCDAFSAMTTDRSYRRAMTQAEAVEELRRCAGADFDPGVVAALIAVAEDAARARLFELRPAA
jgi:HD-GYP domain-containing protein (c-di-GMP phosphodiesterase class II)